MKRMINKYLRRMGWLKHNGQYDKCEIGIDMAILMGVVWAITVVTYVRFM